MRSLDWSASEAVVLAREGCTKCLGLGLVTRGGLEGEPCACVLRQVFRSCYRRFRIASAVDGYVRGVSLEHIGSGSRQLHVYGMKDQEYLADFCSVSLRALEGDSLNVRIFRFHFLLGADWRLCCGRLAIDRANFFHRLYSIEQRLGRVYRELEPYCLYPLDEYFGGCVRSGGVVQVAGTLRRLGSGARALPLVPPLRAA